MNSTNKYKMCYLQTDSTAVPKFECKYCCIVRVGNFDRDNKNNFCKVLFTVLCALIIVTSIVVVSMLVSFGKGNDV